MKRPCAILALALVLAAGSRPLSAQDSAASRVRELAVLAGQVDALEAAGDWRKAIGPLDRLLQLNPNDPARLRQRGLFAAWSGDRAHGVELLRSAVARRPADPEYLGALALVLSWSPATRNEGARLFRAALEKAPHSAELLVGYADLLSWTPATRDSAAVVYRRALSLSPAAAGARVGLANLLAWRGKPAPALRVYDSVLAVSPANLEALRGRGAALNQLRRHEDAAAALGQVLALAPDDATASGELARAELGRGRYRSARVRLRGPVDQAFRRPADSALRAAASAVQVSGTARRRENQLDADRLAAMVTGAVGSFKFSAEYERSELDDGGRFRSEAYGGGLRVDHRGLTLRSTARMRTVQGLDPRQWDGAVDLGWSISRGVGFGAGVSRAAVDETRRTVQGELDAGQLRGAVHANLAHLTLRLEDLPGPLDAEATVRAGRYTGLGLEANRRLAVDARASLVLHGSAPWVRLGYGFAASRFDHNAGLGFAQLPEERGGYFSPAEYWSHQGILQLSLALGPRIRFDADGRLGREWVRQVEQGASSSRNTAVAHTVLSIRVASALDLEARFLYVNAFDAFEMKELTTLLKVYLP